MISSLLVEAAIRSVLLALAVWISLRVFRVRNVAAQKAAWGVVLLAALAMPIVLPMASHWSVLPANVRVVIPADPQTLLEELQARIHATPSQELKPSADAAPAEERAAPDHSTADRLVVSERSGNPAVAPLETDSYEPDAVESVRTQSEPEHTFALTPAAAPQFAAASILTDLLLVYLAVAGVLLVRLVCGLMMALRIWRSAKPISGDSLSSVAGSIDLACDGEVRCSAAVASPVTICSAVVLPANYRTWDSEKLRVVLAHERSHIRQGDFYLQLFAGIYAAVVWFSPLGWWLKRKLSDLAEAISDHAGLEEAADRTSYAQILLEFAAAPRPTLIGVAMARNGSISRRIERLLNDVSFRQAFGGTRRALMAVVVIPIALFAATALVHVEAAGQDAEQNSPQAVLPVTGVVSPDIAPVQAGGQSQPQETPEQAANPAAPASPALPLSPDVAPAAPGSGVLAPQRVPQAPGAPDVAPVAPPHAPPNCQNKIDLAPAPPPHGPKAPVHAPAVPRLMILPGTPGHTMTLVAPKAGGMSRMVVLPRLAGAPNHAMLALIAPGAVFGEGRGIGIGQSATTESGTSSHSENGIRSGYHYWYSKNGDSYAVVHGNDTQHMSFSGNWAEGRRGEIEKARKQAGGKDFLWFMRDGKSYFIDDPSTLAQIEAMYKPMEELGRQQEELGKKQEALGKQQEELGRQQESASVPTPDMSKQIAEIDAAMAKLKASQGKNMTQEQFAEIQEKLGELQGKLGEIQGQIGSKQGEFGARMGELGGKMGELGAQQGELGERQGRIAAAADQKVKSIIDENLKSGKAKPVQ